MNPTAPTRFDQRRATAALLAAGLGTMMLTIDNSIVVVALQAIQQEFGASLNDLQLILVAYLVAQGVFLLIGGSLADRYGRRRIFLIGLTIFTVSSLACGLATSAAVLDVARVVQGLGSAVLLSGGVALLNAETPPERRGRAFGIWGALLGLGLALGPIVGGVLVTFVGWRWIFLVNVPVGVVVFFIAYRGTRESRDPLARPTDRVGLTLFTSVVLAALVAVEAAPSLGWTSPIPIGLLVAAVALAAGFVAWERRTTWPVFELRFFRHRRFLLGVVGSAAIALSFWTLLVYFPLYFESYLGYSPLAAGLGLLPLAAPLAAASVLSGRLVVGRVRSSTVFTVGLAVAAVGGIALLLPGPGAGALAFAGGLAIVGVGTGLYQAEITRVAISAVPDAQSGVAGGMNMTMRCMGGAFGWAIVGVLFAGQVSTSFVAQAGGTPFDVPSVLPAVAANIAAGNFGAGWTILLGQGVSQGVYGAYLAAAQASYFTALRLVCEIAVVSAIVGAILALALRNPQVGSSLSVPEASASERRPESQAARPAPFE